MTTITKLEQQFKEGKPNGYKITLSDGTFGYLNEKESDKSLKDGDEVTFTAVTPEGKNYKKISVFKAHQPPSQQASSPAPQPLNRPAIHVGAGKSKEELKADATTLIFLELLKYLKDGKLASDKIASELIEWDRLVWAEIDEAFSNKK